MKKHLLVIGATVAAISFILGWSSARELKAHRLSIFNAAGDMVAEIGSTTDGDGYLRVLDRNGATIADFSPQSAPIVVPTSPPAPPSAAPTRPGTPMQPPTGVHQWKGPNSIYTVGNVDISIQRIAVETPLLGERTVPNEAALTVYMTLRNTNSDRRIAYKTWRGQYGRNSALLADDYGNEYAIEDFDKGHLLPKGAVREEEQIYPGQQITDVLTFEQPVASAKQLILELPLSHVGEQDSLRIAIPIRGGRP